MSEKIINVSDINLARLFGDFDQNIKLVEKELGVSISSRESYLKISGDEADVAERVVLSLISQMDAGTRLSEQNILYTISLVREGAEGSLLNLSGDCVCVTAKGKPIKSKTIGQKQYVTAIKENTVVFGIGPAGTGKTYLADAMAVTAFRNPAGTGKTYLAVAMAVTAFRNKEVDRIIITRPAVEAGEKLGFLPGDLQNKVDPYLRPLHDALYDMVGVENYNRYLEKGMIEVAPLAYMRGRTLDNSYIILDEAQNTTPEQMKMFLTRIGFGSKAVITGDITQIDLPDGKRSGLKEVMKILNNIEGIAFCQFSFKDVVRHPLVQKIIKAYEKYDQMKGKK